MDSGNLFKMHKELLLFFSQLLCWSSVKCFTKREWESEELDRIDPFYIVPPLCVDGNSPVIAGNGLSLGLCSF